MSILHVSFFGNVRIKFENSDTELKLTRTIQGLFAYLLLYRHRAHPRDVLAALFWGEQDQEKARGSLNTNLWRLRSIIDSVGANQAPYLISYPSGEVRFNPESPFWLDVATFESQVQHTLNQPFETVQAQEIDQFEQALQLYTGELLEGLDDDWALRERERMRMLYLNSQAYLMHYYQHCGLYERGLSCARKILDIDPLREEIHREMMRLYLSNGQRALAVQQYELCSQVLQTELGILPMEETQLLLRHISTAAAQVRTLNSETNLQEALAQLRQAALSIGLLQSQLWSAINAVETFFKSNNP